MRHHALCASLLSVIAIHGSMNSNHELTLHDHKQRALSPTKYIIWFDQVTEENVLLVGGKNSSLGFMIRELAGTISIPNGFAISVDAYWYFLQKNQLIEQIKATLSGLDITNLNEVRSRAAQVRTLIISAQIPEDLKKEIATAYQTLCNQYHQDTLPVAVRSSATAEDLPTASFAGQQDTYLHIRGVQELFEAVKKCMASVFTERAIVYRHQQGFDDLEVGLSVGVQKMVQADSGAAGVAFSIDPESGFKDAITINGSWGLGESVVGGTVTPDEFMVFKPTLLQGYHAIIKKNLGDKCTTMGYDAATGKVLEQHTTKEQQKQFCLTDDEILELSRYVLAIESFYSQKHGCWRPQDIEWAKDGVDGHIYILQARPETVHAQKTGTNFTYRLMADEEAQKVLVTGLSVGQSIASGPVRVINSIDEISQVQKGDIIVTQMTDPDWVPAMQIAAAIITERGGRTCHAAIVSRELGIPAIVGTGNATQLLTPGELVTIDCSRGQTGYIYADAVPFEKIKIDIEQMPELPVKILLNIADPDRALSLAHLPVQGVGLARLEFILNNQIGIHPLAIIEPERCDETTLQQIAERSAAYTDPKAFFVNELAQAIGMIAAAFHPHPVIVRLSDFKSNEYRRLIGGAFFEPNEENPMIGWRGASRYYDAAYKDAFALECDAIRMVRNEMGFSNVRIMIPFGRTIDEAKQVIELLADLGLERGKDGLHVVMMVEVPSSALLTDQFAKYFDGFSIGSNDLTQLTLGIDRDSERLAPLFDERNDAVKLLIEMAIAAAHKENRYIGICGQAPSDYPEFANFLIDQQIDSISLNPDAVIPFILDHMH